MYFKPPYTKDSIHAQFRTLSKKMHPDKGGDTAEFQKMQEEYNQIKKIIEALPAAKQKQKKKPAVKKRKPIHVTQIVINLHEITENNLIKQFIKKVLR